MRKILLCGVSALAISCVVNSPAMADGYEYEPVGKGFTPPPVYNWSGAYAGLHLGWGRQDADGIFKSGSDGLEGESGFVVVNSMDGLLYGGHVGYNWQWNKTVFGVEADVSLLSWDEGFFEQDPFSSDPSDLTGAIESTIDRLASVRARLGYAFNRTLLYATGGLGYVEAKFEVFDSDEETPRFKVDDFGGVVGGGLEHAVSERVTFGLEGLYYFFDEKDRSWLLAVDSSSDTRDFVGIGDLVTVRARASYRF